MTTTALRILTVSQFYESHRGGLEIVAGHLVAEWSDRGMKVRWAASDLTPPPQALLETGNTPTLKVWNWSEDKFGIPFPLPRPSAIRRLWQEVKAADIVLAHDSLYPTSVVSLALARIMGKSFYVVQHIGHIAYRNPVLRGLMSIANRCIARPVLAQADQVFFISHNTADYFRDVRFRCPPQLVFNGVDTDTFKVATPASRIAARETYGLNNTQRVALFVGRFVEKKGMATIRAMAERMPETTFMLAGWGPIDPKSWALANVRVIEGLSGAQLVPLYHLSDALVLPSFGEGLPLVIQEAMACGLPVLCGSDSLAGDPGASEHITGLHVAPAAPAETAAVFAQAFAKALNDSPARAMARSAYARRQYDWPSAANRYLKAFEARSSNPINGGAVVQSGSV